MGFDNQLFSYIRDGQQERMAITILRPHRSFQLRTKPIQYVTTFGTSQQTERDSMRVDKEVATRDRERVRRRYSRDVDVRYMSSWRNLKEKLLSAYSCNQQQCPIMRERLLKHHRSVHGGGCDTKCSLATSKFKNCVSIKAGPDFDQYSDEQCTDCPMPQSSSNRTGCAKPKGNLKTEKKFAECCTSSTNVGEKNERIKCEPSGAAKSRFDQYVDTSCIKGMLTKNNNVNDREMNKFSKNVNNARDVRSNAERLPAATIWPDSMPPKSRYNNTCNDLKMADVCGNIDNACFRRYVDGCTTPSAPVLMNGGNNCCESGMPAYTDGCNEHDRNACTDYNHDNNFACDTKHAEGCSTAPNINLMNNRNYVNGCCDSINIPDCTDNFTRCSSSYIGNIEAPKFPIERTRHLNEDNQPSTSKSCDDKAPISKTDKPTNTPIMVDGGNSCENLTPYKDLYTVDESTGDDSIMSSLMTIVKNRRKSEDKNRKSTQMPLTRKRNNNNTSHAYKLIPPYAVETNNKSDSKLSMRSNGTRHRRNSNTDHIYREVKEWIREVPMYPGSDKEMKEKNKTTINDLVKTLHQLFREAGSPGYDEKVKNAIEICLNKIPLWSPGTKRDQSEFIHSLADNLIQRLTNLNRKNVGTNSKRKSKNAVTEVHVSLTACNQSFSSQFINDPKDIEVKICVVDWLRLIYSKSNNKHNILKNQVFLLADFVMLHIDPLLKKRMSTERLKINLKITIQKIINDLPIIIECPLSRDMHIQDLANDLATSLLCIQAKYGYTYSNFSAASEFSNRHSFPSQSVVSSEIKKCFENANVDCNNMVINEARKIIKNCYELTNTKGKHHARNEIMNLLVTCTNLSEAQAWNLAKIIIKKVRKVLNYKEECASSQTCSQLQKQFTTSVYTSIEGATHLTYPITSTPEKKQTRKEISKLSPQEKQYMESVKSLARGWMDILPENLSAPDEKEFKENMLSDLAGDITDYAKLRQLVSDPKMDNRGVLKYILSRWIFRIGAFEFKDVDDEMEVFLDKLQELPVPILTQPHYGNRQAMENLKFNEAKRNDSNWLDDFVPKGSDVLQDEISIWIHEQPSEIFTNNDQELRQEKIQALAKALDNKGKKRSSDQISKPINEWLNQVLKPEKKSEINKLTEDLKARLINLPQDATLAGIVENRETAREAYRKSKSEIANSRKTYSSNSKDDEPADIENTMAIFISKFMENHFEIDDPLARRAFNRLLNSHLQGQNPPTRKEIYEKYENNEYDNRFPPEKVLRELEYIKDISDWLKNIPVDAAYNKVGNSERIDFVNSLALSIREIEDDRKNNPAAMDYDLYLFNEIGEYLVLLPIPKEHRDHFGFIVGQLYKKIIMHRGCSYIEGNESIDTTGINPDNIGDFIEEFIRINGDGIAHDELKMEAWAIRLIREIKKLIQTTPSLSKAHIYDKLINIRVPSDETAKNFALELDYVKEITDWIKNLPLLSMDDSEKDNLTKHICELAEKIVETDRKKIAYPDDKGPDKDFTDYVAKWISELPLDKKREIVLPTITQQLLKRIEKLKLNDNSPSSNIFESSSNKSIKSKKSKSSIDKGSKKNKNLNTNNIIDAIEKWSSALPVKAENDAATANIKNDICRRLFQNIGQLNMNPTVNNNDTIYKSKLEDEIDTLLDDIPQNEELKNNKGKLKDDIVNILVDIRKEIKEKTAGSAYKQNLEKTIESSIPNPIPCYQVYDPGFEIYKNRLATAFILENFDHGTDAVKIKYENLLKKEIEKYFNHARDRNSIPLSQDQLNNEIYNALFKVPIPNEVSVIDEVEKAKTRCEIDAWFEELPMIETNGIIELLNYDKILSTLAQRIHEIEKSESKSGNKIFQEIMKWLAKLPLKPGNESKHEEYAKILQNKLKSTKDQRKCILGNSKAKNKKNKTKAKGKVSPKKSKENGQIAGPSNNSKIWTSIHEISDNRNSKNNPTEEINDIVHTWCNQLPINVDDRDNAQILKDDIAVKIIVKISDIYANDEILKDDVLYDKLLGEEIEKILSTIPTSCSFDESKARKISELKERLKSLKPCIEEERASHNYVQELVKTVDKIVDRPENKSPEKEAYLDELRNNIIDDFIQYKYSNDDDEDKQIHKINLQDNMSKCALANTKSNTSVDKKDQKNNSLLKANQLISEMAKILPKSNNIVRDKVEEIRMKKQIAKFFDEIGVSNKDIGKLTYIKQGLTQKLRNLERKGYSAENENKMKQEILKCLKKLGKEKNSAVIEAFISKLKNSEKDRKMPQGNEEINELTKHDCSRACPLKNQDVRNENLHQPAKKIARPPPTPPPRSLVHKTVETLDKAHTSCQPNCGQDNDVILENIVNEDEEIALRGSENEESSSDDEDERICLCEKIFGGRHKRSPYCMMPIPMPVPYVRDRRDLLSSLWCGMPMPLF